MRCCSHHVGMLQHVHLVAATGHSGTVRNRPPYSGMSLTVIIASTREFAIDSLTMHFMRPRQVRTRPEARFTIDLPRLKAPNIGPFNRKQNSGRGGWFAIDRRSTPLLLAGQKMASGPKKYMIKLTRTQTLKHGVHSQTTRENARKRTRPAHRREQAKAGTAPKDFSLGGAKGMAVGENLTSVARAKMPRFYYDPPRPFCQKANRHTDESKT